jgi:hypothetical protein
MVGLRRHLKLLIDTRGTGIEPPVEKNQRRKRALLKHPVIKNHNAIKRSPAKKSSGPSRYQPPFKLSLKK